MLGSRVATLIRQPAIGMVTNGANDADIIRRIAWAMLRASAHVAVHHGKCVLWA